MLRSKTGTDLFGPGAAAAVVAGSGWGVGWLEEAALSGTGVADSTMLGEGVALLDTAGVGVRLPPQAHNPIIARLKSGHKRCTVALTSGWNMVLISNFTDQ